MVVLKNGVSYRVTELNYFWIVKSSDDKLSVEYKVVKNCTYFTEYKILYS